MNLLISPIRNLNLYNSRPISFSRFQPLSMDTVTFTGKPKNLIKEKMKSLDESSFPSQGLRDYMLQNIDDPNKNIIDIHAEYYQGLQSCTTLDEAKELYPEFQDVIDASELDLSKINPRNSIRRIADGAYPEIDIENLSLDLLKKFYKPIAVSRDNTKFYYGIELGSVKKMMEKLNIKMDKRYSDLLGRQATLNVSNTPENIEKRAKSIHKTYLENPEIGKRVGEASRERWQDAEYRQRTMATINSAENKQKRVETSTALWKDPNYRKKTNTNRNKVQQSAEYRKKRSLIALALWQDEDFVEKTMAGLQSEERRQKLSQSLTEYWQDPDYRARMAQAKSTAESKALSKTSDIAAAIAWEKHPEAKHAFKNVAKQYPKLRAIMKKKEQGKKLTDKEKAYRTAYFAECAKRFPNIHSEVRAIQKDILQSWDFYNKDRNPFALLETAELCYSDASYIYFSMSPALNPLPL